MATAAEPLMLRLPKDLLVLQPLQGHLDLEPALLTPGLRCVIGAAEHCAMRLTKSDLVRPEHCVIEVVGRQTLLTEWTAEATWLNDRLITEPSELVPGDRVSIGPFDFRVRPASADELLYAKLVERGPDDADHVEEVLRLKRAIDNSDRDDQREPALDLFNDLLHESSGDVHSDSHDRLTQHLSKLLGDLQSQVLTLQGKEAKLNEPLHHQREESNRRQVSAEPRTAETGARRPTFGTHDTGTTSTLLSPVAIPAPVRPEYEQVLQLLKIERDQLGRERSELTAEQARWHEQQLEWSGRLQSLETQLAELEDQRRALVEEKDICRALAEELLRDEARLAEREDRLRREELELASAREDLNRREQTFSAASNPSMASPAMTAKPSPVLPKLANGQPTQDVSLEIPVSLLSSHAFQTFLTLISFCVSAFFLGTNFGDPEVNSILGWSTAVVGAISTVLLLIQRCFATSD